MASLHDMTVTLDMSQLDQIVKVRCLAKCEYKSLDSTCELKRITIGQSGVCLNFTARTTRLQNAIRDDLNKAAQ